MKCRNERRPKKKKVPVVKDKAEKPITQADLERTIELGRALIAKEEGPKLDSGKLEPVPEEEQQEANIRQRMPSPNRKRQSGSESPDRKRQSDSGSPDRKRQPDSGLRASAAEFVLPTSPTRKRQSESASSGLRASAAEFLPPPCKVVLPQWMEGTSQVDEPSQEELPKIAPSSCFSTSASCWEHALLMPVQSSHERSTSETPLAAKDAKADVEYDKSSTWSVAGKVKELITSNLAEGHLKSLEEVPKDESFVWKKTAEREDHASNIKLSKQQKMDSILMDCFLKAVKTSVKDRNLPMMGTTLYGQHMRAVSKRNGVSCDVKDSSYVWLRSFLDALEEDGLLRLKPEQKDPMVIWINRKHPSLQNGYSTKSAVLRATAPEHTPERKSSDAADTADSEKFQETANDAPVFNTAKFDSIVQSASEDISSEPLRADPQEHTSEDATDSMETPYQVQGEDAISTFEDATSTFSEVPTSMFGEDASALSAWSRSVADKVKGLITSNLAEEHVESSESLEEVPKDEPEFVAPLAEEHLESLESLEEAPKDEAEFVAPTVPSGECQSESDASGLRACAAEFVPPVCKVAEGHLESLEEAPKDELEFVVPTVPNRECQSEAEASGLRACAAEFVPPQCQVAEGQLDGRSWKIYDVQSLEEAPKDEAFVWKKRAEREDHASNIKLSKQQKMDQVLMECFLKAVKTSVRDNELPMMGTTLYGKHMRAVSKRSGISCDVKDSSYVWLRPFLDALEEDKLLKLKPEQKDPMVIWINREHPSVRSGHVTKSAAVKKSTSGELLRATAQERKSSDAADSMEKFQDTTNDAHVKATPKEDIREDATESMKTSQEGGSTDVAKTSSDDWFANISGAVKSFFTQFAPPNDLSVDVKAESPPCSPAGEDLDVSTTDLSAAAAAAKIVNEIQTSEFPPGLVPATEDSDVPADELPPVIKTETECSSTKEELEVPADHSSLDTQTKTECSPATAELEVPADDLSPSGKPETSARNNVSEAQANLSLNAIQKAHEDYLAWEEGFVVWKKTAEREDAASKVSASQQSKMDKALMDCFLQAVSTQVKDRELPMMGTTLYQRMRASRKIGSSCDVKDSSHVWLRPFLESLEEKKLLKLKPEARDPTVTCINRNHPTVTCI